MTQENDRRYMRMALSEARKGLGRTSPNPCVGAVIVKDGCIISKGYHRKAGEPHAEINALRCAGRQAETATVYVTLEPCNHTGRTPPCSAALVNAGVKRVVVGMGDPNPLVDGGGIAYLREQGIEVESGILEEECRELNRPFIKHITTGLPWVIMKAGLSLDGRITYRKGNRGWMSSPESLSEVHRLRNIVDAIMVGVDTVRIDNPSLTTRLPKKKGRDPLRIIVDSNLSIPLSAQILRLDSTAPTCIFCAEDADPEKRRALAAAGAVVRTAARDESGKLDLPQIMKCLGNDDITSVLVEGGAKIHGSLLKNHLVDCAKLFYAPIFVGDKGTPVIAGLCSTTKEDAIVLTGIKPLRFGCDLLVEGDVQYR